MATAITSNSVDNKIAIMTGPNSRVPLTYIPRHSACSTICSRPLAWTAARRLRWLASWPHPSFGSNCSATWTFPSANCSAYRSRRCARCPGTSATWTWPPDRDRRWGPNRRRCRCAWRMCGRPFSVGPVAGRMLTAGRIVCPSHSPRPRPTPSSTSSLDRVNSADGFVSPPDRS